MKTSKYMVKVNFANGQVSLQACNKILFGVKKALKHNKKSWPTRVTYRKLQVTA